MRIAILIVASIFSLWSAGAQTTGQMRVEKVKPFPREGTSCLNDTVTVDGIFYYVLHTRYNPNKDNLYCYDSIYKDGNFLAYYDVSANKISSTGLISSDTVVAWTYTMSRGKLSGADKLYYPSGSIKSVVYHDVAFYNDDGSLKKVNQFFSNGNIKRVIFFNLNDDNGPSSMTGALEYDTKGNIVYKYNCATQTKVTLNPDGSVKAIEENVSCDDLYKMK